MRVCIMIWRVRPGWREERESKARHGSVWHGTALRHITFQLTGHLNRGAAYRQSRKNEQRVQYSTVRWCRCNTIR